MTNNTRWSEEDLIKKGFTKDDKGNWNISSLNVKNTFKEQYNKYNEAIKDEPFPQEKNTPPLSWFINGYQVPSKKNSRISMIKNGKIINIPSNKYREYVNMTKMQWEVFGREFRKSAEHYILKYPLKIELTFIRTTKQRFDYFGPAETVADLMQDFKWIPDDDTKHFHPSFGEARIDKQNPGVIIRILYK